MLSQSSCLVHGNRLEILDAIESRTFAKLHRSNTTDVAFVEPGLLSAACFRWEVLEHHGSLYAPAIVAVETANQVERFAEIIRYHPLTNTLVVQRHRFAREVAIPLTTLRRCDLSTREATVTAVKFFTDNPPTNESPV